MLSRIVTIYIAVLYKALAYHQGIKPKRRKKNLNGTLKALISDALEKPCPSCGEIMSRHRGDNNYSSIKNNPHSPTADHVIPRCLGGVDNVINFWICCNICDKSRGYLYSDRKNNLEDREVISLVLWLILHAHDSTRKLAKTLFPEHQDYFEFKRNQLVNN